MTCSSISMECECPHHHHQPSAARRGVKTPNHGSTTRTAPTQGTATSRVRAAASWPSGAGRGTSTWPRAGVECICHYCGHQPRPRPPPAEAGVLCWGHLWCGPAGSGTQVASSLCQPGRRSRATSGTTSRGPAVASSPPSRAHRDSRPATGHVTWTLHTGLGRKWEE